MGDKVTVVCCRCDNYGGLREKHCRSCCHKGNKPVERGCQHSTGHLRLSTAYISIANGERLGESEYLPNTMLLTATDTRAAFIGNMAEKVGPKPNTPYERPIHPVDSQDFPHQGETAPSIVSHFASIAPYFATCSFEVKWTLLDWLVKIARSGTRRVSTTLHPPHWSTCYQIHYCCRSSSFSAPLGWIETPSWHLATNPNRTEGRCQS